MLSISAIHHWPQYYTGVFVSDFMPFLIENWRTDPSGTYQSWFLWEERIKNFRSIRRGLQAVVSEIAAGSFGTQYRGSSLETVVHSVAEQRQIFKGADHAFLWKPKLRIPNIYENPANQRAFGHLLDTCMCCNTEAELLAAIRRIDALKVKGKMFATFGGEIGEKGIFSMSVKLPVSSEMALTLDWVEPTGYGLGKSGWVTARIKSGANFDIDTMKAWIAQSYRAVAPKRLVKLLV